MGYKQKLILLFSIAGLALVAFIVWLCWPVDEWKEKAIARNTWRSAINVIWENGYIRVINTTAYPLNEVKIAVTYCNRRQLLVFVDMKTDTIIMNNIKAGEISNRAYPVASRDAFCGGSAETRFISIYAPAFEFCFDEVKEKLNVEDKFRCR